MLVRGQCWTFHVADYLGDFVSSTEAFELHGDHSHGWASSVATESGAVIIIILASAQYMCVNNVGFDHGIPCRVKKHGPRDSVDKAATEGRGFCRNWGPRAMFFTRHGRPWSNPILARSLIDFFFILFTETWILEL